MDTRASLRLRIIVDLLGVCLFGFAAPFAFISITGRQHVFLVALASFFLSLSLLDMLRTRQRLRKLRLN
jgi:hypothetical protein